ncbi:MAG: exopolysaccharide biosynthesis polyprenyl glycosylphosphotransferase [Acidobacteriota bacterium]
MSAFLPFRPRVRSLLVAADGLALVAAVLGAHAIRFPPPVRAEKLDALVHHPGLMLWMLLSGLVLLAAAELYESETLHRLRESTVRTLVAAAAWAIALVVATYVVPAWDYGRGLLALTAAGWFTILLAARALFTHHRRRQRWRFPALVVGEEAAARRFCHELASRPSAPWKPVYGGDVPLSAIDEEIRARGASIVIIAGRHRSESELVPVLTALHFSGVPVVVASEVWAWLEERLPLEALSPALFLHQPGFGAVHWTLFNRVTRIADIVLSLLLLIASAPIFVAGALLVALSDGRPVLYRQARVGQFGRRFVMLKLRTMRRDAERSGPRFAAERDPRVLPVGHMLRRFRIDELPQLLNVLRGDMSLVGPRPERPDFVAQLSRELSYYSFRLAVQPGLTGWAQVNIAYARDLDGHRRKLEYDLYFIRERSLRLYLLTLLRTVSAALVGVHQPPAPDRAEPTAPHPEPLPDARSPGG